MKYTLIIALLAFNCISSTAQEELRATAESSEANESISPTPLISRLSITSQQPTPKRGPCFYQQPLNIAIYNGDFDFIKTSIEKYRTSCMPLDTGNRTSLHIALREYEDEHMANYLLNREMQYGAQDEDGKAPSLL